MPSPASRLSLAVTLVALVAVGSERPRSPAPPPPSDAGRAVWREGIGALAGSLARLEQALGERDTTGARAAFRAARRDYKRIEGLLYFHSPILTAEINSPRIDDDDA